MLSFTQRKGREGTAIPGVVDAHRYRFGHLGEGRGREEKGAREEEVEAPTAQPASSCTPDALRAAQAANPMDLAARTLDPVATARIEPPPRLQDRSPVVTA